MTSFQRFLSLSLAGVLSVTCITVASARVMTGTCPEGVTRCLLKKTVKTEAVDTSCKGMKGDRLRECQLSGKRPVTNAVNNVILMRGRCAAKTAEGRKLCKEQQSAAKEDVRHSVGKRFVQASQNAQKTQIELKCKPLKTAAERIACTKEVRASYENERSGQ